MGQVRVAAQLARPLLSFGLPAQRIADGRWGGHYLVEESAWLVHEWFKVCAQHVGTAELPWTLPTPVYRGVDWQRVRTCVLADPALVEALSSVLALYAGPVQAHGDAAGPRAAAVMALLADCYLPGHSYERGLALWQEMKANPLDGEEETP